MLETIRSPRGLFVVGPAAALMERRHVPGAAPNLTGVSDSLLSRGVGVGGPAFHFKIPLLFEEGLGSYRKDFEQGERGEEQGETWKQSSGNLLLWAKSPKRAGSVRARPALGK